MALTTKTYAEQLGRTLAEAAASEPAVEEVWVSTRPDGVDLWLITKHLDMDAERDLHTLADVLYARHARWDFDLFVVNPRHFLGDVHQALPRRAVQVPFHTT